jgi:hypothetical protein
LINKLTKAKKKDKHKQKMQIEEQEYTPYLSRMMGFICVMDNQEAMDKVICKSTKHIKDKHQNGKPHNKKKITKCVECGCSVLQKKCTM